MPSSKTARVQMAHQDAGDLSAGLSPAFSTGLSAAAGADFSAVGASGLLTAGWLAGWPADGNCPDVPTLTVAGPTPTPTEPPIRPSEPTLTPMLPKPPIGKLMPTPVLMLAQPELKNRLNMPKAQAFTARSAINFIVCPSHSQATCFAAM